MQIKTSPSFSSPSHGIQDRSSIPLFDKNDSTCLQKDFQKMAINLNAPNLIEKERDFKKSRKSSESQNYNSNQILEEFSSGMDYGPERKESFNSQGSFKREQMRKIMEESPENQTKARRKSSGLERETKGIFSERKKTFPDSRSIFSKLKVQNSAIPQNPRKVEVVYSKCMVTISAKFFNNLKNDSTLLNNDKLLQCMLSILTPILEESPPSQDYFKNAIQSICFPFCETSLSLLVFNMLVLAARFPEIEKLLLEKVINFAIKLDCDLSPIRSSQNLFPVPKPLCASSVFQASIKSSPMTIFGKSSQSRFQSSVNEKLSIFSQVPLCPNFSSEASSKLETVLLLLTLYSKFRLQANPNFSSFFRTPQLHPLLHRFLQTLKNSQNKLISLNKLQNQRAFADFLINIFSTRILRLKRPNLIQFYVFISISLKTPAINPTPFQNYFMESFFEKLILNVFNISVHTPIKIASLNYIQGFMANSRRVSDRFQFIVLKYLLKLQVYYFKKAKKSMRSFLPKDLSQIQFAKFSKFKRSKILNTFSHPVFVRVILFQARLFERFSRELKPIHYTKLVKGHESFLSQNQK